MKSKNIIPIIIIVLVLGAVFYYIVTDLNLFSSDGSDVENRDTNGIEFEGEGNPTIEVIDILPEGVEIPSLDRKISFPDFYNEEAQRITKEKIDKIRSSLLDDPGIFVNWIELGLLYKGVNDYEGAREAWEYASALRPENSLSFGNLGRLYGYYLHENDLAEENYKKALENGPTETYLYFQATEFYRDVVKDINKAIEVVKTGLSNIPGDSGLTTLLYQLEQLK